ncbi:MAG: glucokinase [Deltaproteobacteria bacterium]|nr:glucokinase [Deltaproteobacteria bacterium]
MRTNTLLAADVGATNTRIRLSSLSSESGVETLAETSVKTTGAAEIKEVISTFTRQHVTDSAILASVLGLPGKVSSDCQSCAISFFDPHNYVSFRDLFQRLNIRQGVLVNDLECGIAGLPNRADPRLKLLSGEPSLFEKPPQGQERRLVLGMPGTGLGIGLGTSSGSSVATTIPSEGGHTFAAIDSRDELELLITTAVLEEKGENLAGAIPTYQDFLRGGAIPIAFRTLLGQRGTPSTVATAHKALESYPPGEQPQAIASWALSRQDPIGHHARDTFTVYGRFLGRFLQSFALSFLPNEVFLGGNIAIATHSLFKESFTSAFCHHPIHSTFLKALPVQVALIPTLNLDGATRAAEKLVLGQAE